MSLPPEVEMLISDGRLSAHLATSVDDRPHVAPVWYVYGDEIVSVLTGGRKLRNVRRNPKVALSVEKATERGVEWNVTMLGTATVVDDEARYREVGEQMDEKYRSSGETDGGETDDSETDNDGALVEIRIGSASYTRY